MKQDDYLTEQMFLALRTRQGVKNLSSYEQVLEPHYKDLVQKLVKQELAMYEHDTLQLTDQ